MLIMKIDEVIYLDRCISNEDIAFYIKLTETMTVKDIYNQYYSKKYRIKYTKIKDITRTMPVWPADSISCKDVPDQA